jgi:hypothetical protein
VSRCSLLPDVYILLQLYSKLSSEKRNYGGGNC